MDQVQFSDDLEDQLNTFAKYILTGSDNLGNVDESALDHSMKELLQEVQSYEQTPQVPATGPGSLSSDINRLVDEFSTHPIPVQLSAPARDDCAGNVAAAAADAVDVQDNTTENDPQPGTSTADLTSHPSMQGTGAVVADDDDDEEEEEEEEEEEGNRT